MSKIEELLLAAEQWGRINASTAAQVKRVDELVLRAYQELAAMRSEIARLREALRDRDRLFCEALIPEDTRVIEAVTSRFNAMRPDAALTARKDGA